ncbi:protein of unknown function [Filimonas lacunae]|uniref:DUF4835 domain-containing protein n=1 Tax=Filimonas lacunae TaxID=477680 RepID=A0A173MMG4_9BACT|nr:DUF4835 family protein [Filimonas lacunae]BAV08591.1 hypothetical protein FLA_4637 [Filimonas lacunae]SIS57907.1 protein of unknown function [Filimonas lacunae]
MIKRSWCLLFLLVLLANAASAQELQAKVTVMSQRVYNNIDKKIFTTLQNQLTNLLNNRKWTSDTYQPQERIGCNFLITITDMVEQNVFKASLTVQAARPVYSSSYQAALVNYQDAEYTFKYQEFQPIEFNENRVQGNDPLEGNLTATLAFYVYMILGFDYDSFAPKAGAIYFQKAQSIVNNAPESRNISGWRAFDGLRNRYWLSENLINTRYNIIHDAIYSYYRKGLDQMFEKENDGRKSILEALTRLQAMNQESPNTMILQFFMQGKSAEMIGIFKKAAPQDKIRAADLLSQLDIPNLSKYKQELK